MTTRWRAIGRARGYSRRALRIIGMAEVTNRARSRWVLPPWSPLPKPDGVVCSRQVAGVILPTRCVLVAQRMRDEGEEESRMWAKALRASGFTREELGSHLDAIMAKDCEA